MPRGVRAVTGRPRSGGPGQGLPLPELIARLSRPRSPGVAPAGLPGAWPLLPTPSSTGIRRRPHPRP